MRDDIERRLAAILAAAVVCYSRMMAADDAATLDVLRYHRGSIFDPAVANNNGRLVKLIGVGLVAFTLGLELPVIVSNVPRFRGAPGVPPHLPIALNAIAGTLGQLGPNCRGLG